MNFRLQICLTKNWVLLQLYTQVLSRRRVPLLACGVGHLLPKFHEPSCTFHPTSPCKSANSCTEVERRSDIRVSRATLARKKRRPSRSRTSAKKAACRPQSLNLNPLRVQTTWPRAHMSTGCATMDCFHKPSRKGLRRKAMSQRFTWPVEGNVSPIMTSHAQDLFPHCDSGLCMACLLF